MPERANFPLPRNNHFSEALKTRKLRLQLSHQTESPISRKTRQVWEGDFEHGSNQLIKQLFRNTVDVQGKPLLYQNITRSRIQGVLKIMTVGLATVQSYDGTPRRYLRSRFNLLTVAHLTQSQEVTFLRTRQLTCIRGHS